MCEDSTNFTIKINNENAKAESISRILSKYANSSNSENVEITIRRSEINIHLPFTSFEDSEIEAILLEFERVGSKESICTTWYDTVGENLYATLVNGRLQLFDSLDELNEVIRTTSEEVELLEFDYGKKRNNRTALIRLKMEEGKSDAIADLFRNSINMDASEFDAFSSSFEKLVDSDTHDIKWCAFKWKNNTHWYEGPDNLIYALKFVERHNGYIYLGFDMQVVDVHGDRYPESDLERLIFVLSNLVGVKKTWIKLRPNANSRKELYIYHPGMGDEPMALSRKLTADSEWPR